MKRAKNLPDSDRDLCNLALIVSNNWLSSGLNLQWMSFTDFLTLVQNYQTHLDSREVGGSIRPSITQQLQSLEEDMDKHLMYVKGYILDKYGKDQAKSYYSQFGIVHKGNAYSFPTDKEHRLAALNLMIQGLQTHGFTTQNYGLSYWQTTLNTYKSIKQSATDSDSLVSAAVMDKNTDREKIIPVLRAIIHLVQAQYPQTAVSILRQWGFQKEKY